MPLWPGVVVLVKLLAIGGRCPRDEVAHILGYDIVVKQFEIQSRYVYFRIIILGQGMKPPYFLATDKKVPLLFFLQGYLWHHEGNYTRMLWAILNKSWRQHPKRHQLYGHLPLITKTIQVRRTRHAGHCWRSRDEFISDVLLWTPTYGRAKAGRPARTYIQQLCEDTGCSPEDLPEAMNDREKWQERVRDIWASGTTWWWWWWWWNNETEILS